MLYKYSAPALPPCGKNSNIWSFRFSHTKRKKPSHRDSVFHLYGHRLLSLYRAKIYSIFWRKNLPLRSRFLRNPPPFQLLVNTFGGVIFLFIKILRGQTAPQTNQSVPKALDLLFLYLGKHHNGMFIIEIKKRKKLSYWFHYICKGGGVTPCMLQGCNT